MTDELKLDSLVVITNVPSQVEDIVALKKSYLRLELSHACLWGMLSVYLIPGWQAQFGNVIPWLLLIFTILAWSYVTTVAAAVIHTLLRSWPKIERLEGQFTRNEAEAIKKDYEEKFGVPGELEIVSKEAKEKEDG